MFVCNCRGITESEVLGAASLGCVTIDDLRRDLGVAACCGMCEGDAMSVVERACRDERSRAKASAAGD